MQIFHYRSDLTVFTTPYVLYLAVFPLASLFLSFTFSALCVLGILMKAANIVLEIQSNHCERHLYVTSCNI